MGSTSSTSLTNQLTSANGTFWPQRVVVLLNSRLWLVFELWSNSVGLSCNWDLEWVLRHPCVKGLVPETGLSRSDGLFRSRGLIGRCGCVSYYLMSLSLLPGCCDMNCVPHRPTPKCSVLQQATDQLTVHQNFKPVNLNELFLSAVSLVILGIETDFFFF